MTAGSSVDYTQYCEMEAADSDISEEEEYNDDEDEDEDGSLASFCASMSGACPSTSSSSSQETVLMRKHPSGKRKWLSIRKSYKIEPPLFCNQCDAHRSAEGTLSSKNKKLCIVCDVII
jgi:hypothetical protein